MKKVLCLAILGFVLFFVCGCSVGDSVVLNNMSDMRINYFEGQNDVIYANLCCGQREETFAYDGVSTNPIECGVITVGFVNICSYSSISIILSVDGVENEYVLEKSPYDNVFMEDIGKIIDDGSTVLVKLKTSNEFLELINVSKSWNVGYKRAIKIGANYFKEQIKSLYFNNTFNAEGYLKVVAKYNYPQKYWYFSLIDKAGKNYSCLIDVNSGKIIDN